MVVEEKVVNEELVNEVNQLAYDRYKRSCLFKVNKEDVTLKMMK